MKRSRYGALLAGVSATAILVGTSGTALADWTNQAPTEAQPGYTVDSSNTPFTSSGTVTGPASAAGNTSAGININASGTTVNVTGGTVTGGTGGNGSNGSPGAHDGGDGGDSAGIYFRAIYTGATINVLQGATVKGGTGGNGGDAGGAGGTAGGAGSSIGVDIRGVNGILNNSGTIQSGTGGSNGNANGGTASSVSTTSAAVGISGEGHATGAIINNNATGQILGGNNVGIAVGAANATISNSGTISSTGDRAIWLMTPSSNASITNSGTITTSGTNAVAIYNSGGAVTITNQAGGVISETGGGGAISFRDATAASTLNNSGTIIGGIKVSNYGDTLNFSGGTITGGIIVGSRGTPDFTPSSTASPRVNFTSGTTTFSGNMGSSGNPIYSLNFSNGATLAFASDSSIYGSGMTATNGGAVDFGTSKVTLYYYDGLNVPETMSGTFYFKTTINSNTGKHGYMVTAGDNVTPTGTMFSSSAPVFVVSSVGSVASGSKYIVLQDLAGRAVANMPSVVNSGGIRWTVSSMTGAGGTDTDGVSYGTGYTDIVLTAGSQNSAATAVGPNGKAVSAIASYSGTNAAMQSLSNAVNNLTSDTEIQKAGAQLRPEVNGGTTQASLGAVNQALGTIQVRTDSVRAAAADTGTGTGISSGEALRGLGVWGQGFGSAATQDRRQDVDGYSADTYGLAFGVDARVLDPVRVGVSFAYARTNVSDSGSRDGSGQKINSYIGSIYGTYTANSWYVDGALTYGHHDYDSTRVVNFTGAPVQVAKASFGGEQYGAKAEFGYPLSVGPAVVTPLASLAYNRLNQDGYTETGAAGANLTVGSSSTDSVRSGLGAKVSTTIAQAGEWNIKPNARAMWLHEFNGSAPDQTSTFVAGGSSFTTSGITVAQEHFNLGVGLDVASVRNTTVSAKYDADLSDRYVSHTGSLQVRTEF
jgi:outer membrane autotransporter protein